MADTGARKRSSSGCLLVKCRAMAFIHHYVIYLCAEYTRLRLLFRHSRYSSSSTVSHLNFQNQSNVHRGALSIIFSTVATLKKSRNQEIKTSPFSPTSTYKSITFLVLLCLDLSVDGRTFVGRSHSFGLEALV